MSELPTPKEVIENPTLMRRGHFAAASGKHTDLYWLKYRLLEDPEMLAIICKPIATGFSNTEFDVIVGPTLGGAVVAYEVARQLGKRVVFAERSEDGKSRVFRQPQYISPNHRVLIVDDILMTGWTLQGVIDAVLQVGAQVCGIGVILDRSIEPLSFVQSVFAVRHMPMSSYDPAECPMCAMDVPLTVAAGKV